MKILITGASSYVGARLYFDLRKNFETIGTYSNSKLSESLKKLDVTNEKEVDKLIKNERPNIIIHVAANANSRWCEANSEAAVALNEKATQYVVNAANKVNAKVFFISSFAAIKPTNLYGRTKQNSEKIVKQTKAGWIILRPSLILGYSPNTTNDRPFNRLLKNLDMGEPAIYDTSWKFQTSYVGHISEIIKAVIDKGINNEIIPVVVREIKTRYDTARDILGPFNIKVSPVDKHDNLPLIQDDLHKLKELGLPIYTYKQVIEKIVDEIKNRDKFKLD